MTLLLEGLWEGRFLDESHTREAITRMTEWTPFDDCTVATCGSDFPDDVRVYSKGGRKGGASVPQSWAGLLEMGPDAVAITVTTEDNRRISAQIQRYAARYALLSLKQLAANLGFSGEPSSVDAIRQGDQFENTVQLKNRGGGQDRAFDVEVRLSTNQTLSTADALLGRVRVNPLGPYGNRSLNLSFEVPESIAPGDYYLFYWIDASQVDEDYGEVGEWDEGDNTFQQGSQITVLEALDVLFEDDFESGTDSAWASSTP